jgi:hypothetical protein
MKKYRIVTKDNKLFWVQERWCFVWFDVKVYDYEMMSHLPPAGFIPTKLKVFDSCEEAEAWVNQIIIIDKPPLRVVKIIDGDGLRT